jgi:hypothetical protein
MDKVGHGYSENESIGEITLCRHMDDNGPGRQFGKVR